MKYVVEVRTAVVDDRDAVAGKVAQAFHIAPAKALTLLRRVPGPVTRPVSAQEAKAVADLFASAGLDVVTREVPEAPPAPEAVGAPGGDDDRAGPAPAAPEAPGEEHAVDARPGDGGRSERAGEEPFAADARAAGPDDAAGRAGEVDSDAAFEREMGLDEPGAREHGGDDLAVDDLGLDDDGVDDGVDDDVAIAVDRFGGIWDGAAWGARGPDGGREHGDVAESDLDGLEMDGPDMEGPDLDGPEVDGPDVDGPDLDGRGMEARDADRSGGHAGLVGGRDAPGPAGGSIAPDLRDVGGRDVGQVAPGGPAGGRWGLGGSGGHASTRNDDVDDDGVLVVDEAVDDGPEPEVVEDEAGPAGGTPGVGVGSVTWGAPGWSDAVRGEAAPASAEQAAERPPGTIDLPAGEPHPGEPHPGAPHPGALDPGALEPGGLEPGGLEPGALDRGGLDRGGPEPAEVGGRSATAAPAGAADELAAERGVAPTPAVGGMGDTGPTGVSASSTGGVSGTSEPRAATAARRRPALVHARNGYAEARARGSAAARRDRGDAAGPPHARGDAARGGGDAAARAAPAARAAGGGDGRRLCGQHREPHGGATVDLSGRDRGPRRRGGAVAIAVARARRAVRDDHGGRRRAAGRLVRGSDR